MKRLTLIVAITTIINLAAHGQNQPTNAYPVLVDGLWGYINEKGDVIIKPRFRNALAFSEGLAPVRLNGTYGFIDLSGNFVIQPQYDYAGSFYNGRAKIYLDGKPYYVDKSGKEIFEHNFSEIGYFNEENGLALVSTVTNKKGFIDWQGKLVIDTIYNSSYPFAENRVVVVKEKRDLFGVLDSKGRVVVPMRKFTHIESFRSGYARVDFYDEDSVEHTGIIDTTGTLKLTENYGKWSFDSSNSDLSDAVFIIRIYKSHRDSIRIWPDDEKKLYYGAMDIRGEVIVSDTAWKELTPFVSGRAFARDIHGNWYLVDKTARRLNSQPYEKILYGYFSSNYSDLFHDGKEIVLTADGWCLIDIDGNVISKPGWLNESTEQIYRSGNMVYFSEEDDEENYRTGYCNLTTGEVVSPQFQSIDFTEARGELSLVIEDGRSGYINKEGVYVWRGQPRTRTDRQKMNIDYMNRAYFYAASPPKSKLRGLGGWGGSKNMFMRVTKWQHFERNKLSSTVFAVDEDRSSSKILYVANTTKNNYFFDAQDSRLYLKLQALDRNGKWRDIEYLPGSWCGNSYHQLYLPPNHYWSFELPVYEGDFKTKLRAELVYKLKADSDESLKLYSQEFEGSVNPGQFWRKAGYVPNGIMDPYND